MTRYHRTPPTRWPRPGFRSPVAAAAVLILAVTLVPALAPAALGNHGTRTLDVRPEVQEKTVLDQVNISAELSAPADDASGAINVDFELESGPNNDDGKTTGSPDFSCVVAVGANSCTATYTGTAGTGTDVVRAWIDHDKTNSFDGDPAELRNEAEDGGEPGDDPEPDITDVVEVVWNAAAAAVVKTMDCEPEAHASVPAAGTSSSLTFTCSAKDAGGGAVPGVRIDGENLDGANDPDDSNGFGPTATTADYNDACTTGGDGTCTVTITPTEGAGGAATFCFWADYPVADAVYDTSGINSNDGGDCDNETTGQNDADRTDTVGATWLSVNNLALGPGTGTAAAGTQQSATATLRASNNAVVPGVEIIFDSGPANEVVDSATTDASGVAPFAYTGTHVGTDTITAFADLNNNSAKDGFEPSATVTRTWTPGALTRVDCTPETAFKPVSPAGSSQQAFTCDIADAFGNPVTTATKIDAELVGPNDPDDAATGTADFDDFCTTSNGSCSANVSATETQAGAASICFWADGAPGDTAFDPAGAPTDGGGCTTEAPGALEDNAIDVVVMTWTAGNPARLDCNPDLSASPPTGPGSDSTYTCTVRDVNDNLVGAGIRVDAENLGGTNDPDDSAGGGTNTTPDWDNFCTTAADGTCSNVVPAAGEKGTANLCFWIDTVSSVDNRFTITGAEADGGACDSDPVPPAADNSNATDVVTRSWEDRVPSTLTLTPGSATTPLGKGHGVVATLADQFGGGVGGVPVRFTVTGTTDKTASSTTTAAGKASLTYAGTKTGDDTITAYADLNSNGTKDAGEPEGTATNTWVEASKAGGYWLVAADGGIFSFGNAAFHGSAGATRLARPIVGMVPTPSGAGYWLVAADGGIFSFGDAEFFGSTGALKLNQPIVGMAATPTGKGYWLVAADGGIFSFGDAQFYGSTGALRLARPIVGMVSTIGGNGYWLVAADGGIFSFGDAQFYGSTGALKLARPIVGMAPAPSSQGYWLVAADGGIFAFGDAQFFGSTGSLKLAKPVVGMAASPTGKGYWLVASDGGIFAFGDADFFGSTGSLKLAQPIVGMAPKP